MRKPAMKRKPGVDVVIALGPAPKGPRGPMMEDDDEMDMDMKSRCDAMEKRIKRLEEMLMGDEEEMEYEDEDESYEDSDEDDRYYEDQEDEY